ncbi:MAG: dienelactone hydrolase [Benniella sp.]|nr:MAG: dienelactone hydrolase [Benniella sp.]
MNTIEVTFPSNNIKISAHRYVPRANSDEKFPALVVLHPGGGTAGLYARKLAENGYVTLAFDRRYQGTPRNLEDPFASIEDTKSAVTYLACHDKVDADRIGILGVCAGGGYAIFAASTDPRVKAIGTVSMVCIGALGELDRAHRPGWRSKSRIYAKTGQVKYLPYVPSQDRLSADSSVLMREGSEYYLTSRGSHPGSVNKFALWSYNIIPTYDSFAKIERLSPRPLLLVAGKDADTIGHSHVVFWKAKEPKELHTIEGATHIDLYDKRVDEVAVKLTEFTIDISR